MSVFHILHFNEDQGKEDHSPCTKTQYDAVLEMQHVNQYAPKYICSISLVSEKAMAPHSSVLAQTIPGTGESGGLLSMGSTESDTTEVTQQRQQQQPSLFATKKTKQPHSSPLKYFINIQHIMDFYYSYYLLHISHRHYEKCFAWIISLSFQQFFELDTKSSLSQFC